MSAGDTYISVIIPTYRDWTRLEKCLHALSTQKLSAQRFEVVVANNDPQDRPPAAIGVEWPFALRIVDAHEKGSYAARNEAVAHAKHSILAFTDADCVPDSEWLAKVADAFASSEDQGENLLLSGDVVMFSEHGGLDQLNLAESYDYFFGISQRDYARRNVACTANLSTSRHVFDLIRGFDATQYSGGDVNFCERATGCGARFEFSEQCVVNHPLRDTYTDLLVKSRRVTGARIARRGFLRCVGTLFPPAYRVAKILSDGRAPLTLRLKASLSTCVVKGAQITEYLSLLLRIKQAERR